LSSRCLAAAAMLAVSMAAPAVSACSTGAHPGPARSPQPAGTATPPPTATGGPTATASDLVLDSWVTAGRGGYFVSGAWDNLTPAFSLYTTVWTAELDAFAGVPTGLDAAAVARWAGPALGGGQQGSGLPAVAQVTFATRLFKLVGARVDATTVATALESLRVGSMYRSAPTAAPDWGSTAVAVETLRSVASPVPPDVAQGIRQVLASADPAALDAHSVTDQWIPVLKAAVALRATLAPADMSKAAALVTPSMKAAATLPPGVVRVADTADLRDLATALGVAAPDPRVASWCGTLVDPSGRVDAAGVDPGDPQVTLGALRLGCPRVARPTSGAPSRSGWPGPTALDSALRASVAGYRVARATGLADRFTTALRWSAEHTFKAGAADPFGSLELAQLRDDLRLPPISRALPALGPNPRPDALLAWSVAAGLGATGQRADLVAAVTRYARESADPDIIRAALYEQASRLTGAPGWHDRAMSQLAALRAPDGSYDVAAGRPGPTLIAEAVGAWITGTPLDTARLARLRLCRGWACGDQPVTPGQPAPAPALTALAEQLTCVPAGCGGSFPLVL
jgi:hypothetical protein